jgi:hypothetical protein
MKDYKIGLIVFLFLATVISLFPPFEFGNDKLKTLQEEYAIFGEKLKTWQEQADIVRMSHELPVKKFDFLFGDNKKDIVLKYDSYYKKFYDKDSLAYYKNLWKHKIFIYNHTSFDTFYIAHKFLFKNSDGSKMLINDKYTVGNEIYFVCSDENVKWIENYDKEKNVNYEWNIEDAVNYNEVKDNYNKSPNDWGFRYMKKIDDIKKYDEYIIATPNYYLLNRNILLGELLVEYFLAFILSISVQLFINWKRKLIS